jgi:O-antigen/teichoic acid export membrane protein
VLWALTFLVGPGFFFPLEQEVGRAFSTRRVQHVGAGPLAQRSAVAGAALTAVLALVTVVLSRPLVDHLFDGETMLLVSLLTVLLGYAAAHVARGMLAGGQRFARYGTVLTTEGLARVAIAAALSLGGVVTVGPYGLAFAAAPLLSAAVGLWRQSELRAPGPPAPWGELSASLGYLIAGSLLAQVLVNAGPLAVELLASEAEEALAGRFLASLIVARVPLFLFLAVQAALLPKLAALAASERFVDFRTALFRLLVAVSLLGAAATAGSATVGPDVVRILFGEGLALGRRDLAMLAAASSVYMVALALAQALIALSGHARAAVGWLVGGMAFFSIAAWGGDLIVRVERAYLGGSLLALVAMAALLRPRLTAGPLPTEMLVDASLELPIEP